MGDLRGGLVVSVIHTVRYRKDHKRDVTFVCSLINFDRHRLIMMIIAGRPASEFLCLHKLPRKNKKTKKRKGTIKKKEKKKGKRALARFLQWTINIPMFSKRLEKATT